MILMRLEDTNEYLTELRRDFAALVLPVEAQKLRQTSPMPEAYLVSFFGPQITAESIVASVDLLTSTFTGRFTAADEYIHKLADIVDYYLKGLPFPTPAAGEKELLQVYYQMFLKMVPGAHMFAWSVAKTLALLTSWAMDKTVLAEGHTSQFLNAWEQVVFAINLVISPEKHNRN